MSDALQIMVPPVLYRYRPWSVVKANGRERKSVGEIEGRFAYFSSPVRFNDPQDSLLGPEFAHGKGDIDRLLFHELADPFSLARERGCSVIQLDPKDPAVKAAAESYNRREARKNTRILCLSWDWRSPLMWTFYAQEHQGFCLGYDTSSELFQRARPVVYTHSPNDVLHLQDPVMRNDPLSFCKSPDWQFEREWRVCLPEAEPKRVDPSKEVEPKRIDLSKEKLVSIHVGYRMKEAQLQEIADALSRAGYKPDETKLFRMERSPMSFLLSQRLIGWQA